jgi:hypothetical protein
MTSIETKRVMRSGPNFAKGGPPRRITKFNSDKDENLTRAEDDICVAILESNSCNLKTPIETFFLQNSCLIMPWYNVNERLLANQILISTAYKIDFWKEIL